MSLKGKSRKFPGKAAGKAWWKWRNVPGRPGKWQKLPEKLPNLRGNFQPKVRGKAKAKVKAKLLKQRRSRSQRPRPLPELRKAVPRPKKGYKVKRIKGVKAINQAKQVKQANQAKQINQVKPLKLVKPLKPFKALKIRKSQSAKMKYRN